MASEGQALSLEAATTFLSHFVEVHLTKAFPAPPREATRARLRAMACSELADKERELATAHRFVSSTFIHDDWQNRMRADMDLLLVRWQLGRYNECLELVESLIRLFGGYSGLYNLGASDLFFMKGCILESNGCDLGAAKWFAKSIEIRRKNLASDHRVLIAAQEAFKRVSEATKAS